MSNLIDDIETPHDFAVIAKCFLAAERKRAVLGESVIQPIKG